MRLTTQQANAITGAVWLVGLGILLVTGFWWPGILFLVGVGSVAQGLVGAGAGMPCKAACGPSASGSGR